MIEVRLFTLTAIAVPGGSPVHVHSSVRGLPELSRQTLPPLPWPPRPLQRRGSRAVHRLATAIRGELGRARAGRQSSPKGDR